MARKLEDNHSIATPVSVLRAGRSDIKHHPINLLGAELEALEAEYRALWNAVIAYMNLPVAIANDAEYEAYMALSQQVMRSRFWNEQIEAQGNTTGAGGVGEQG